MCAGHVAGTGVLRYEDTEEGQERIRKWAARREKDEKRQEISDARDAEYISGVATFLLSCMHARSAGRTVISVGAFCLAGTA